MPLPLPIDTQVQIMEWLEPVEVMQLRSVCRAWREEAPKAIQVVGLIDDFEGVMDAHALKRSFAAACNGRDPLPGDGSWKGKFPALSFPSFHVLPNVRRVEVAPTYSPLFEGAGAKAVADVCATWPDLEELVVAAMPPRGHTIGYWTYKNELPRFSALDLIRELRGRCPNLRVLSFRCYPRGDTPKRADVGAFARGLAELANLEVLDATMFGKYAPIAGNVLMRCTDCFARLRVFVAPERLSSYHKLFPVLLQHAPLLEELHIPTKSHNLDFRGCEKSCEPLINALREHGGLHVLTLRDGAATTEGMVSAMEALPKLHTCSVVFRGLTMEAVDRIAAVLRRGVMKRMAFETATVYRREKERLVALFREADIRPLLQYDRDHYFAFFEVEEVTSDRGDRPLIDDDLLIFGDIRAGDRWAASLEDGSTFCRALVDDERRRTRHGNKTAWKAARAAWPDVDMYRFAEACLDDPRRTVLGRERAAANSVGAAM